MCCSGSVICYCAICVVLVVSFVTVQCGVCHAVSVCNECELCLTVICYVLFLEVVIYYGTIYEGFFLAV